MSARDACVMFWLSLQRIFQRFIGRVVDAESECVCGWGEDGVSRATDLQSIYTCS